MTRASTSSILNRIAREVGVSKVTVARILGGKKAPVYRKATERARQVRELAVKLNYRPNAAAKAVGTGRFRSVALLLDSVKDSFPTLHPGILDGIYDALAECDWHLGIARVRDEGLDHQANIPKVLRENMSDGLLVNYFPSMPQRVIELIRYYHIPHICINIEQESNCVYPDDLGTRPWPRGG